MALTHYYRTQPTGSRRTTHTPDAYFVPYLLTGDAYYLQEEQNWAAAQALYVQLGAIPAPAGARVLKMRPARSDSWVLRNRANAELITPDSQTVLKQYFASITNDAIAMFEGEYGIATTYFQNSPIYNWAVSNDSKGSDPLHFIECQANPFDDGTFCSSAQWMHYYFVIVLGTMVEHGFTNAQPFLAWLQTIITGQIGASSYNNYNFGSYWISVLKTGATTGSQAGLTYRPQMPYIKTSTQREER